MFNRILKGTLFFCLFFSTAAQAWFPSRFVLNAYTGVTSPAAPDFFKVAYRSGYLIGFGMGRNFGHRFEITADFSYSNFAFDIQGYLNSLNLSETEKSESSALGGESHASTLVVNFKSKFPTQDERRFVPYLYTELGLFDYSRAKIEMFGSENIEQVEASYHSTAFGTGLGLGLSFVLESHSSFFIDLGAKIGLTRAQTTVFFPIRFGVAIF